MANEAEIINNPDSTPGAVSTGYQAQNTNLVAQRTGIDKTYVSGGVGTATVEISGPVDVNGVLYDIKSQTILTPPSAGRYYITLQGAGPQYLTPTLGTSSGTFDPLKNARYDVSNHRVLNWVIYFDGTTCYANRLLTPETENNYLPDINEPEETWITSNGNWIAPRSKYYTMYVTGSGGDGLSQSFGGGGSAGGTGIKRIFVNAGDTWTSTFSSSAGGATVFTDGVTNLSATNGNNATSFVGASSGAITGFDINNRGGDGGSGVRADANNYVAGIGGASFWGGGGRAGGKYDGGTASAGENGRAYGSGGGGGPSIAGTGAVGVIRIVG